MSTNCGPAEDTGKMMSLLRGAVDHEVTFSTPLRSMARTLNGFRVVSEVTAS
jgi:hypothetical protein